MQQDLLKLIAFIVSSHSSRSGADHTILPASYTVLASTS